MIKLFFKKSFLDGWDNVAHLVLLNAAVMGILLVLGFVCYVAFDLSLLTGIGVLFICLIGFFSFEFLIVTATNQWVHFRKEFKHLIKETFKGHFGHVVLESFIFTTLVAYLTIVVPVYLQNAGFISLLALFFLFWFYLITVLALQYFVPMAVAFKEDKALVTLRKCFGVMFDNKLLSLVMTLKAFFSTTISFLTFGLLPGFTGIKVGYCSALKLIVIKYDYMEKNHVSSKNINVEEMLKEEDENVGPFSLRDLLFPWKGVNK